MRERQLEQDGVTKRGPEVLLEIRENAGFLLVEGRTRLTLRLLGLARSGAPDSEERQEASEERRLLDDGRFRLTASAAASSAATAPRAGLYPIAFIASVTLCPPNPNEFDRAARTFTVRA